MKSSKFYPSIWQTIPYSFQMVDHYKNKSDAPLHLLLTNTEAKAAGVYQMTLLLTSIALVDLKEAKNHVHQFTKPTELTLRSMESGYYIKTKDSLKIAKGQYKAVRFYIDRLGNSVTYANKNSEPLKTVDYLDFKIKDQLLLENSLNTRLLFKFDLEPMQKSSFSDAILKFFSRAAIFSDGLARTF